MTSAADLADQLAAESAKLDAEVREIDLLVGQARSEAGRHETRRTAATDKLAALDPASPLRPRGGGRAETGCRRRAESNDRAALSTAAGTACCEDPAPLEACA